MVKRILNNMCPIFWAIEIAHIRLLSKTRALRPKEK